MSTLLRCTHPLEEHDTIREEANNYNSFSYRKRNNNNDINETQTKAVTC